MTEDIQPVHGHVLSLLHRTLEELAARDQYFYAITMFSYVGTKADQRRL